MSNQGNNKSFETFDENKDINGEYSCKSIAHHRETRFTIITKVSSSLLLFFGCNCTLGVILPRLILPEDEDWLFYSKSAWLCSLRVKKTLLDMFWRSTPLIFLEIWLFHKKVSPCLEGPKWYLDHPEYLRIKCHFDHLDSSRINCYIDSLHSFTI